MWYKLVLGLLVGGAIGGVVGYFGKCASGTCPLTGSPVTGAVFGAIIGLLVTSTLGGRENFVEPSKHLIELKAEGDLESLLSGNDVVLVEFYSDRCPPCRRLKPTIHELATEYAGRAAVVAVNVQKFPGAAGRHSVTGLPDVRIFKAGEPEKRIPGLHPKKVYTELLEGALKTRAEVE